MSTTRVLPPAKTGPAPVDFDRGRARVGVGSRGVVRQQFLMEYTGDQFTLTCPPPGWK